MTKITLQDVTSLTNESTALSLMAANNAEIETKSDTFLSRDGTTPNSMSADLDMNSNRIMNLPAPIDDTEPVRLVDLDIISGDAAALATAVAAAQLAETNAELAETNAETAAADAQAQAARLQGTSATSILIGTGSKVFTTQSGKFFNVGNWLLIASDADEANYMHGQVTAYTGTSLTVNITNVGGSGTFTDWLITLSGTRGATGATGAAGADGADGVDGAGDVTSAAGSTDNAIVRFDGVSGDDIQTSVLTIADSSGSITGFADASFLGATSGNELIVFNVVSSAVNEITVSNNATTGQPTISATGDDANIELLLTGKGTGGVVIEGTATTGNAAAGHVGEVMSSVVENGSAVALVTDIAKTVTSVTLTPGDWDLYALGRFTGNAGTTVNYFITAISTVTDSLSPVNAMALSGIKYNLDTVFNPLVGSIGPGVSVGPVRISISSNTTYFLVVQSQFGTSTAAGFGGIYARRQR